MFFFNLEYNLIPLNLLTIIKNNIRKKIVISNFSFIKFYLLTFYIITFNK